MDYIKLINSIATSVSGKALTQILQSVGRVAISTVVALMVFASPATAETYFYHNDHLGTPQALTDGDRSIVWQAEYDPFGKATETVATVEQNQRFPGQYLDRETGLHYNYFRTYDPEIGRYLESDPIGLGGGMNTYGYAYQNPVLYTDPTGEFVPAIVWWAASAAWAAFEIAGSAYDAYDTYGTITNECSSKTEKAVAGGLFAAGIFLPGAGYSKIDDVAKRTFDSPDPHVADLANRIEKAYPGHVVGTNVPIRDAAGNLVTDADILLKNAVVQVKSGGGKGMTSQLTRTEGATGLPTLGYGPDLKSSILKSTTSTNDAQLLIDVVKP